jgi:hypothetical protein
MIKVNSWNEYDTLKTVILGNVYDLDRIPKLYQGQDQESFVKIIEETAAELKEIKTILEQNGVTVLQPKQPTHYNNLEDPNLLKQSPLINMRDFHMAYGNWFIMTYGSYYARRFQHLWLEDIVNQIIADDNIVVNSNEPNINNYSWNDFKSGDNWRKSYDENYADKNLLHTACILKYNKIAFIRESPGTQLGKKWIKNILKQQNVSTVEVTGFGHLDGSNSILNKHTIMTSNPNVPTWKIFKNKIVTGSTESYLNFRESIINTTPTQWLHEWQGYSQEFEIETNVLSLSPNKVMLSNYNKSTDISLKNLGIEPIYVKWSHRAFWQGGLHCITCDLERYAD